MPRKKAATSKTWIGMTLVPLEEAWKESPLAVLRSTRDKAAALLNVIEARELEDATWIDPNTPLADQCLFEVEQAASELSFGLRKLPRIPRRPGEFPRVLSFPLDPSQPEQTVTAQSAVGLLDAVDYGLFGGESWERRQHFGLCRVAGDICKQLRKGILLLDSIMEPSIAVPKPQADDAKTANAVSREAEKTETEFSSRDGRQAKTLKKSLVHDAAAEPPAEYRKDGHPIGPLVSTKTAIGFALYRRETSYKKRTYCINCDKKLAASFIWARKSNSTPGQFEFYFRDHETKHSVEKWLEQYGVQISTDLKGSRRISKDPTSD